MDDYGFDPNYTPYQRRPQQKQPVMGNMQQFSPYQQPSPGDVSPLDGGYTPQQPPVGGQDYLSFLQKMAGKKAF